MEKIADVINGDDWMAEQFGLEISKQCDIHGEYVGRTKLTHNQCPECIEIERKSDVEAEKVSKNLSRIEVYTAQSGLPTKYHKTIFDDWIAEDEKMQAAKDKMISFSNGEIKRMLMIGTCGTGKTMLCAAIVRRMVENRVYPVYTTVPRLIRDIRDGWSRRDNFGNKVSEQEIMDKYIKADVLIVDELGSGRCTDDDKLIFSEILCDRYSEDLPTLLVSNLSGEAIKATVLDERASDRMREDGVFVSMQWQSKRK